MGVLFISHSGRDNDAAIRVRDWLKSQGWGQAFLDLDPEHGLAPGHRWLEELKQAGARCSGVLVLIFPIGWRRAGACGNSMQPIIRARRFFRLHRADAVRRPAAGTESEIPDRRYFRPGKGGRRLRAAGDWVEARGSRSGSFEWPPPSDPHRAIYRGLQSLDEEDAGIFGRDALITKALDALRQMRNGAVERLLVILGASGAGKSSFLKAGLIARLKRDEENFVLPVIRPERAALSGQHGLAACLARDPSGLDTPNDILTVFANSAPEVTVRLRRYAESAHEIYAAVSRSS